MQTDNLSYYERQNALKAMQESVMIADSRYITDAVIGFLSNEVFWLVVLFWGYRLLLAVGAAYRETLALIREDRAK